MNSVVQPHFVRNVRAYRVEIVHAVTVFARNVSDYFVSAKNYTRLLIIYSRVAAFLDDSRRGKDNFSVFAYFFKQFFYSLAVNLVGHVHAVQTVIEMYERVIGIGRKPRRYVRINFRVYGIRRR